MKEKRERKRERVDWNRRITEKNKKIKVIIKELERLKEKKINIEKKAETYLR